MTNYLNLSGAVALPLLLWDMAATERKSRARALAWAIMAMTLCLLVWLHPRLDQFVDAEAMYVVDHDRFYVAHQVYLIGSALQWASAIAFLVTTLQTWHDEERDGP